MKKILILTISFIVFSSHLYCGPKDSVVCITSHGASATVIHTERGRSILLGCAHAYTGKGAQKRMTIEVPYNRSSSGRIEKGNSENRLLKVDYNADLSLVEIGYGPLPNVCKVAPSNYVVSNRNCLSVGYDEMIRPQYGPTKYKTTIISTDQSSTYTQEIPWHGRSGGALISDNGEGYLIGVVQGYEVSRFGRQGRGIYVNHRSILSFLRNTRLVGETDNNTPLYTNPNCPNGVCPNGACPNGACPNGACPHGVYPNGACPNGNYPLQPSPFDLYRIR